MTSFSPLQGKKDSKRENEKRSNIGDDGDREKGEDNEENGSISTYHNCLDVTEREYCSKDFVKLSSEI